MPICPMALNSITLSSTIFGAFRIITLNVEEWATAWKVLILFRGSRGRGKEIRREKDIGLLEHVGQEVPRRICEQLPNSKALARPQDGPCLLDIRKPKGQNKNTCLVGEGSLRGHQVGQIPLVTRLWRLPQKCQLEIFLLQSTMNFFFLF
ncbi:uncharacterized protein LOC116481826 [Hylobates moloch]|uniref:uncharacterized protein LOC116481826 n=1 Tax=Hylobates moloch TaxID=81572 RepID=UPI0013624381|nr:uncharacterized protein LOC116481826 [Hylobates moloch]XP_032030679.1 uncharacterized protein LOC116481826 [Hylobates moloch]